MSNYLNELSQKTKKYRELKNELELELKSLGKANWGEEEEIRVKEIEKKKLLLEAVEDEIKLIEKTFEEIKLNDIYEEYITR